jgi:RecB family endonuclease NucS
VKKSRFTEAQIIGILRELDAGTTATELARKHGLHRIRSAVGAINMPACKRAILFD